MAENDRTFGMAALRNGGPTPSVTCTAENAQQILWWWWWYNDDEDDDSEDDDDDDDDNDHDDGEANAGLRFWRPWRTEKNDAPLQILKFQKIHFRLKIVE